MLPVVLARWQMNSANQSPPAVEDYGSRLATWAQWQQAAAAAQGTQG
jgi:hypothetical protein